MRDRAFFGRVLVILSAILGAAISAAVFHEGARALYGAITENAAGYGALFTRARTFGDAFAEAVAISRADIAVMFISLIFPYTAAACPLAAGTSFLRAAILLPSLSALTFSPLGIISVSAGPAATLPMLMRVCVRDGYNSAPPHGSGSDDTSDIAGASRKRRLTAYREAFACVRTAVVCSGALIAVRTLLLLLGSAIYNR